MAATPASIQVAVVLAAALLATTANPTPGLGNIIGSFQGAPAAGGEPNRGNGFSDIITFPKPVINAFLGNRRPLAPPAAAHSHGQGTSSAPTSAATPIPTPTPTSTSTSTPPPSPTTAATTTAAVHHTPPPSAAPAATEGTEKPASQTVEHSQNVAGNYTAEELEKCRQKWVEVANTTINENVDILTILLDYGGFPGQMSSIKWERNATDDHPDRWTYFFGDSDYKTYIRNEVGEIYSKSYPVRGATPVSLSGNIYWTPADFCGKLRHAKYTQGRPPPAPAAGGPMRPRGDVIVEVRAELCSIADSKKGKILRCSDFLADRAPLGPALIATLVG